MVLTQLQKDKMALFQFRAAKAKGVLNPPLVVMLMLYPTLLGFGLAARLGFFNLLIPIPILSGSVPPPTGSADALGGPHDLWRTDLEASIVRTVLLFVAIAFVHMSIVLRLTANGPVGSYKLTRFAVWMAAAGLWLATSTYMVIYVSVARYGAHNGEWYAAGSASVMILFFTGLFVTMPLKYEKMVDGDDADLEAAVADPAPQ